MPEVKIYQRVKRFDTGNPMGEETLLERVMTTDFLPRSGDEITAYGDVMHRVKRVWWQFCGCVEIGMVPFWIDPPPPYDNQMGNGNFSQWWTDRDGDLTAFLREAGWTDYVASSHH